MTKIQHIIEEHKNDIQEWMLQQLPIEDITKNLGIARDTFKKRFPFYKGNRGFPEKSHRRFGSIVQRNKICERCGKEFTISGKEHCKHSFDKRFCSTRCAKSREDYWKDNATQYTTIAQRYHIKKCCVCGFEKVLDVHHLDHDSTNNSPENLIYLCPNHHRMIHSKYKDEIISIIESYIKKFKMGLSPNG